jgi:hypothetical protein
MQSETNFDPLYVAMKYVAGTCIDEGLTQDAEALASFLDLIRIAPRTVGLLQVWTLSQRGLLSEALRQCEELVNLYPDADEFQPVLAVLRYAGNDRTWRSVCERLLESESATPESKRLASSLLDGTFGTKKPSAEAEADEEPAPAAEPAIDYAAMGGYMRA